MEQYKIKENQTIEALKKKLVIYKQTLDALQVENVVEDYLLTKDECYEIKKQVSTLEGEIKKLKENQDVQISEYNKKIENISDYVESVNDFIRALKQDVDYLMNKIDHPNFNDLKNKIDKMIDIQNTSISLIQEGNVEMKGLKEEFVQSKKQGKDEKQLSNPTQNKKNQPSSYRQLQNMLQSSNNVQPYSGQEKKAMPRRQDFSQKVQQSKQLPQQAFPTKGKQMKNTNSNVVNQYQELNKMNYSKNKIKLNSKKASISINEPINPLGYRNVQKSETQNVSLTPGDQRLNRKKIPIENKKLANNETLKGADSKTVHPIDYQNINEKPDEPAGENDNANSKPPME